MNKQYVNIDDVLDLFGVEDEDLYATGTIEDALYDGTLKVYEFPPAERQGQWILKYGDGRIEKSITGGECSLCGFVCPATRYCPNCGAKMYLKRK